MIQMLKNTMDEAAPISTQDLALDYIAKRGPTIGIKKEERPGRAVADATLAPTFVKLRNLCPRRLVCVVDSKKCLHASKNALQPQGSAPSLADPQLVRPCLAGVQV